MSDDRPVLLFGETFHHPNILYRTGFLVPDPGGRGRPRGQRHGAVGERARGGPRPQGSVGGRGAQHAGAGHPGTPRAVATSTRGGRPWSTAVCREHGLNGVDVDADFPTMLADHLRHNDVDVRSRSDIYQQRRRIKTAQEVEWITATENAGMAALQKAIDIIAASEIRDGLLFHEGSQTLERRPHLRGRKPPARERLRHRGLDLLRWPGVGRSAPGDERCHPRGTADRARHLPVRQAHALLGRHDAHGRPRDTAAGGDGACGRPCSRRSRRASTPCGRA